MMKQQSVCRAQNHTKGIPHWLQLKMLPHFSLNAWGKVQRLLHLPMTSEMRLPCCKSGLPKGPLACLLRKRSCLGPQRNNPPMKPVKVQMPSHSHKSCSQLVRPNQQKPLSSSSTKRSPETSSPQIEKGGGGGVSDNSFPASASHKATTTEKTSSSVVPTTGASTRYQCPECGLVSSSRNCWYKCKLQKHKTTVKVARSLKDNHIVCPECKTTMTDIYPLCLTILLGVYNTII